MVGGAALNGKGKNVACLGFCLVTELGIQLVQALCQLVLDLALHTLDQLLLGFLQFFHIPTGEH